MTFAEEFVADKTQEFQDTEANYPTAFGITFTPKVSGIAFGILGVLGAFYILSNFVMPAYDKYQKQVADVQAKEAQVNQQKSGQLDQKQVTLQSQLQQAQARKAQILALFSDTKTLDTLLLDINNFFKTRKVKLLSFQPQGKEATVVSDSSLGAAVNNKLQRQSINLEMEGSFENTQLVLRDLERLQPLLLMKNVSSQVPEEDIVGLVYVDLAKRQAKILPQSPKKLKTTLTLDVILPASPQASPPAAQPQASPPPSQ
jgi:hypothetical protein